VPIFLARSTLLRVTLHEERPSTRHARAWRCAHRSVRLPRTTDGAHGCAVRRGFQALLASDGNAAGGATAPVP